MTSRWRHSECLIFNTIENTFPGKDTNFIQSKKRIQDRVKNKVKLEVFKNKNELSQELEHYQIEADKLYMCMWGFLSWLDNLENVLFFFFLLTTEVTELSFTIQSHNIVLQHFICKSLARIVNVHNLWQSLTTELKWLSHTVPADVLCMLMVELSSGLPWSR